MFERLR
jgi:hypothetical protein